MHRDSDTAVNIPETATRELLPRHGVAARRIPSRRPDLASLTDVRRELSRVYRDMRFQKIDPSDGTRLAYVLVQIGKLIQSSELEARINALERALGGRAQV